MSKVIKVSDEIYNVLNEISFKNRVSIQHLADAVIAEGIEKCKSEGISVIDRGQEVKIEL